MLVSWDTTYNENNRPYTATYTQGNQKIKDLKNVDFKSCNELVAIALKEYLAKHGK